MKQTPLRRTQPKPWIRPEADKVTDSLRDYILTRDGGCIAAALDPEHRCKDRWNVPHASYDLKRLTLDHVHDGATMGKRAPSDKRHLVAACGFANNEGWCSAHRQEEREYLARVEPDA